MVKQLFLPSVWIAILAGSLWWSPLQAAPPAAPGSGTLISELTAQQALLVANQARIDKELAAIKEDLRLARLFSARSGGKTSTP